MIEIKYDICSDFTSYIRGPSANALSTHLPVTTTSAPSSRARVIGTALFSRKKGSLKYSMCVEHTLKSCTVSNLKMTIPDTGSMVKWSGHTQLKIQ